MMDANPNKLLNTEEARLQAHDPFVTLSHCNELYFNPLAMTRLEQTVGTPTNAVGFELLSHSEVIVHFIEPGTAGAVTFKRPENKRTGRCSFTAIGPERVRHPLSLPHRSSWAWLQPLRDPPERGAV